MIYYSLLLGLFSFLFILALNKGEIRFYIIAGELIGGLFYYVSFGIAVMKITDRIAATLKKVYKVIAAIICAPFRLIKRLFTAIKDKLNFLFKKSSKNSEKIKKKHLQKMRVYVYNLIGVFFTPSKHNGKDVGRLGSKQKGKKRKKEKQP